MNKNTITYKVLHRINLIRLKLFYSISVPLLNKWYLKSKYPYMIKKYKNLHKGERCFIIGNGPSLSASDLELIKNEITFSCNKIYNILGKTDWKPYYYVVDDTGYVKNDHDNILNLSARAKFIGIEYDKRLAKPYLNSDVIILRKKTILDNMIPRWSLNLENYVGSGHSVTFPMVQMAIYMGFKEIYFIGQDCSTLPDCSHFYSGDKIILSDNDLNNFIYAFYAIKQLGCECGVKIYNATRGGKLDLFDRVELEKVL